MMPSAPMTELSPARRVALDLLIELEESGAYARDALDASPAVRMLDRRDAGLATRLVLGVVATYGCLDELIDTYCDKPGRMNARIRNALRISAFELLYLGTEPRVVVSQGVELVRTRAKSAAGFANAVLRRACEDRARYLDARDIRESDGRATAALSRQGGLPEWLVAEFETSLGAARTRALVEAGLEPAPVAACVNPLDATAEEAVAACRASGDAAACPAFSGCVAPLEAAGLVASGVLRRDGAVVCDLNAQVVACAATVPGATLEVGAGRGTKTFVTAATASRSGIERTAVALEVSKKRSRLNRRRMERAGLAEGIRFVTGDGCDLDGALAALDAEAGERMRFDCVLVDAPCSGTGTMRRHPEIPWRLDPIDIDEDLPRLQLELLTQAARRVRAGGQLIYATCSVLHQENADVVDAFLDSSAGRGFSLEPVSGAPLFQRGEFAELAAYVRSNENARGLFQTVPAADAFDGHFCARLVRVR